MKKLSAADGRVSRVAYFATHPIQYQAPLLRYLAADPQIDLEVFFYSDFSLHEHFDPGYGVEFKWDVPLVQGYNHSCPITCAPAIGAGSSPVSAKLPC